MGIITYDPRLKEDRIMNNALDIGENLKLGWNTFTSNAVALIVGMLLVAVVGGFSLGICLPPMLLGYNQMVLRATEGESVEIGDVFGGFKNFLPAFILYLLMGVSIGIGMMLFVIPGIILAFMFIWAPWILAQEPTMSPIDCLKASVEAVKGDIGGNAVFVLVFMVLSAAGNFVPFGGLLTSPVATAMMAHGFKRVAQGAGEAVRA